VREIALSGDLDQVSRAIREVLEAGPYPRPKDVRLEARSGTGWFPCATLLSRTAVGVP